MKILQCSVVTTASQCRVWFQFTTLLQELQYRHSTIKCHHSHLSTSVSGLSVSAAVSCPSTVSSPSDLFSCSSWSLSSCFFFFFLLFLSYPSPLYSYCKRSECGVSCSVQVAVEPGHLILSEVLVVYFNILVWAYDKLI